jgi:2'-hydroxyisoflavone reductase
MKILILGGTGFVGRILTENLLISGIEPVLFNRGKRNPDIFPGLKRITGDRETDDIKKIYNEDWDVVVDFSGQFPDTIDSITNMLKGKLGRYVFISSVSAYVMDNEKTGSSPVKEDSETYSCTEEQKKDKDVLATYSQKKAECERILLGKDWLDAIIFRPALIYGRYDPTDRFYYWLYRARNEIEILVPDNGSTRSTSTYSEDFARIIEKSMTIKTHNRIYNAVTQDPVSLKEIIEVCCKVLYTSPDLISARREYILKNNVQPWSGIPLWLGGPDLVIDNSRLINDFEPDLNSFEDSVIGTADYYSSLGWQMPKYGLTIEQEKELIRTLKSTKNL